MNEEKLYYVYRHIRIDKNEVFYVGIGTKNRWHSRHRRNAHWLAVYAKCKENIEYEIMLDGLTKEQAFEKEKEFILLYGRRDLGTGTLVNMTGGGDGCSELSQKGKDNLSKINTGRIVNETYRQNMSTIKNGTKCREETKVKIGIGNKNSDRNYIHKKSKPRPPKTDRRSSDMTREKISKALNGIKRSAATRKKMGEAKKRANTSGVNSPVFKGYIYQINFTTNEVVNIFDGVGDAAKNTGYSNCLIYQVVNGKRKTSGGFRWERHATKDFYNNKISNNEFV